MFNRDFLKKIQTIQSFIEQLWLIELHIRVLLSIAEFFFAKNRSTLDIELCTLNSGNRPTCLKLVLSTCDVTLG